MLNNILAREVVLDEGVGPRDREPDDAVFQKETLAWIKEWTLDHSDLSAHTGACVFLYDPEKPSNAVLASGELRSGFRISKPAKLAGYAYGCATGLKAVYRQQLPSSINELPDMLTWLKENSLDNCVAVIFIPSQRRAFIKPISGADYDDLLHLDFPTKDQLEIFDFSKLDAMLDLFYKYAVETHTGMCRIWHNAVLRELVTEPEDIVHKALHMWLFTNIDLRNSGATRVELENIRGREDVEIIRWNGQEYELGIIELKVLFPEKSEKANLSWALKGIQQAVDYAKGRENVICKYTVCYDGRKADLPMPAFFKKAAEEAVEGRRYFMTTPNVQRVCHTFRQ